MNFKFHEIRRLLVPSGKKFYDLIMIKVRLEMVKYRSVTWHSQNDDSRQQYTTVG